MERENHGKSSISFHHLMNLGWITGGIQRVGLFEQWDPNFPWLIIVLPIIPLNIIELEHVGINSQRSDKPK
jgi:hypothetical protein